MAGLLDWEELDIDDSDILRQLEGRSSRAPPSPKTTQPSNILPSKRPPDSQIPSTIGILNRFKKQNTTQPLTNPSLSVPSDLPPLEPCSNPPSPSNNNDNNIGCTPADKILSQLRLAASLGIAEPDGPNDLRSQQPQREIHASQRSNPFNRGLSQGGEGQEPKSSTCRRDNSQELNGVARDPCVEKRIPYIIPGPAGAVQRALNKKAHQDGKGFPEENGPQKAGCSRVRREEDDADFDDTTWLCAMDYIQSESSSHPELNFSSKSTIGFIKKRGNVDRIPQVMGIIKTCTPNRLGSMSVTLKDPTGTIGGSIHHKVMGEIEFGRDITIGAVILLRQVVVFSPTPWAHYLNITHNNVVKVFKKGSSPPQRRMDRSFSKKWGSIDADNLMEARTPQVTKDRVPSEKTFMGQKNTETINHMFDTRIDKNATKSQSAAFRQPNSVPLNIDCERTKGLHRPDDIVPAATKGNIKSARIQTLEDDILITPSSEQGPNAGASFVSQNAEVYCNKKATMSVTVDWNDEVEMLMSDQLDFL